MIKGNVAKVADFGLSKILRENQYVSNSAAAFPVRYSAPEMVTGEKPASKFTDVWSYGTLIYEVLTYAQRPFRKYKTNSDVSENSVEVMLMTERDEIKSRLNRWSPLPSATMTKHFEVRSFNQRL